MGKYADVRFAAGLSVIAMGAILTFGVTASPESVNIRVIGLILILVGLAGLVIARWLFVTRRRTDVIYHSNGTTWLEPSSPAPSTSMEPVERYVDSLPPPAGPSWPAAPGLVPGARIVSDPQTGQVNGVKGIMDVEPGSEEFLQMQREWM